MSHFFPWVLRRWILNNFYKYEIHKNAHIGFAYIYPKHLVMKEGAQISHFNIAINLDEIVLQKNVLIDRSNWITGFPTRTISKFFQGEKERHSQLFIDQDSVVTKHHHFDCTNLIRIGRFVTIAGCNLQLLTHSVNVYTNKQESKSINIGDYCFISTKVIILGGTGLPAQSVLAAGAVLNKDFKNDNSFGLYVGIPAIRKKNICPETKYFSRHKRDVF